MPDEAQSNLRLLLENKFNDIRYTKQQQWHLLYLTLIAIGGITSLSIGIKPPLCYFGLFLIGVDIIVGVLGCGFIIYYARWLHIYRNEKSYYLEQVGIQPDRQKIGDNVTFTGSFCLVIVLTLVASVWAITIKLS